MTDAEKTGLVVTGDATPSPGGPAGAVRAVTTVVVRVRGASVTRDAPVGDSGGVGAAMAGAPPSRATEPNVRVDPRASGATTARVTRVTGAGRRAARQGSATPRHHDVRTTVPTVTAGAAAAVPTGTKADVRDGVRTRASRNARDVRGPRTAAPEGERPRGGSGPAGHRPTRPAGRAVRGGDRDRQPRSGPGNWDGSRSGGEPGAASRSGEGRKPRADRGRGGRDAAPRSENGRYDRDAGRPTGRGPARQDGRGSARSGGGRRPEAAGSFGDRGAPRHPGARRRPDEGGRPRQSRDEFARPGRDREPDTRPGEEIREFPPGLAPRADEPATPEDADLNLLSRGVRAELRGLSAENAETVGAHLAAAASLLDEDPALAYAHAEAARRRAARLPVAREAAATTAYAAGEYAAALNEFRALRRMTGTDDFLATMADCERGLGRPQAALRLVQEGLDARPSIAGRVELKLVEAGARVALDQRDEAIRLLRHEMELIGARGPRVARARLRYFYAQLLAESGDEAAAERWFGAAIRLDPDNETGAVEALAALQGVTIEFDESEVPDQAAEAQPEEPAVTEDEPGRDSTPADRSTATEEEQQ